MGAYRARLRLAARPVAVSGRGGRTHCRVQRLPTKVDDSKRSKPPLLPERGELGLCLDAIIAPFPFVGMGGVARLSPR